MPVSGCLSPWAPWGASMSKPAPREGWCEEVAKLTPVMHLVPAAMASAVAEKCPRDAKTWRALGKRAWGRCPAPAAAPDTACCTLAGNLPARPPGHPTGVVPPPAAVGARGRQALPSEGRQPFESSDAFLWQEEESLETQQFLSAFLLDKQNVETNHGKLSLLPSVGGKRKCSFVFFFPLSSFLSLCKQNALKRISLPEIPSLFSKSVPVDTVRGRYMALHSCRDRAKPPPHRPQPVLTARPPARDMPVPQGQAESRWQRLSSAEGLSHREAMPLHPREHHGKSGEGDKDYL